MYILLYHWIISSVFMFAPCFRVCLPTGFTYPGHLPFESLIQSVPIHCSNILHHGLLKSPEECWPMWRPDSRRLWARSATIEVVRFYSNKIVTRAWSFGPRAAPGRQGHHTRDPAEDPGQGLSGEVVKLGQEEGVEESVDCAESEHYFGEWEARAEDAVLCLGVL